MASTEAFTEAKVTKVGVEKNDAQPYLVNILWFRQQEVVNHLKGVSGILCMEYGHTCPGKF